MFAYGTSYLFKIILAILTLLEPELLELDDQRINDYLRTFNTDEDGNQANLPQIEVIIEESFKIKVTYAKIDEI